jgi:hypothetical protein
MPAPSKGSPNYLKSCQLTVCFINRSARNVFFASDLSSNYKETLPQRCSKVLA